MATFQIQPSSLRGMIVIPPSKSHSLRAILFAGLAHGASELRQVLHSPDATAMIHAMRALGASITIEPDKLLIQGVAGRLEPSDNVIDAGNSGLVLRFIAALGALLPSYTILTGDHSIRHNRPVKPLLEAIEQLGGFAVSSRLDGFAPIIIKGAIHPGHAKLSGEDSQPVSALLIATSLLNAPSTLEVTNPGEKPWIDLTLHWLKKWDIGIKHEKYSHYTIPGSAKIEGFSETIPGDLSSAAFPIVAALITRSELLLMNIDRNDCQGDKKVIEILQKMGARFEIDDQKKTLRVQKNSSLKGMRIDINDFIDAAPILSVIGCFAEGETEIIGASIARHKESDRLHAMATELKKMGATIEERLDGLRIAYSPLKGAHLFSWNDHRIAMSLSIAALSARGESHIEGTECISKTYPSFAHDFRTLGAMIEVV